jgi:hypothetical protein
MITLPYVPAERNSTEEPTHPSRTHAAAGMKFQTPKVQTPKKSQIFKQYRCHLEFVPLAFVISTGIAPRIFTF